LFNSTPYDSITILGRKYTRQSILKLDAETAKKMLAKLGFSTTGRLTKTDALELLWKVKDHENMAAVAAAVSSKSSRLRQESVQSLLPMLTNYREHFASIDKLDVFLAETEPAIKHAGWRTRLLERIMMVGFNNVRVMLLDEWSRRNEGVHELKKASEFLDALFDLFCQLAEETQDPSKWLLEHPRDYFFATSSSN
jgi:transposase-like protein